VRHQLAFVRCRMYSTQGSMFRTSPPHPGRSHTGGRVSYRPGRTRRWMSCAPCLLSRYTFRPTFPLPSFRFHVADGFVSAAFACLCEQLTRAVICASFSSIGRQSQAFLAIGLRTHNSSPYWPAEPTTCRACLQKEHKTVGLTVKSAFDSFKKSVRRISHGKKECVCDC
jgi:hypothetical protein